MTESRYTYLADLYEPVPGWDVISRTKAELGTAFLYEADNTTFICDPFGMVWVGAYESISLVSDSMSAEWTVIAFGT